MEELRERKDIPEADRWDLRGLFENDEAWEEAFAALDALIAPLAGFAGRLKDAAGVRAYLDAYFKAYLALADVAEYAYLRHSEDTREQAAQSMYLRADGKETAFASAVAFARPEILSLPEETLKGLIAEPLLHDYAFLLEDMCREKAHTLSAPEERLLAGFGEVFSAPGKTAGCMMDADMTFERVRDGEGREVELTGSNYITLQSSTDRTLRKNAFCSYYRSYRALNHSFSSVYAAAVKGASAVASARGYGSSREMSLAGENIPVQVYDNLVETVRRHMPSMYRYVELRKRLLQLPELHYYDLYAPLTRDDSARYTYAQAQQIVLDAVAPLGEDYVSTVRDAFSSRWIDVYPNRGKRGGAFSAGTYRSNPFIMTNFSGTLDSVSTIAHEMGHSMHSWYAKHAQPAQYADYTLFVAEVASTVNENLLIEDLLARTDDPERRMALLRQYLENFKGTVFRQTMFAEFEQRAHAMSERGEALTASALNDLYRGLICDYFGPSLVIDDEVSLEWSRIPHFYRPFYVYKYATGYSSAVALSEAIRGEGAPAVRRYREFLSMGGSAYPLDELKHAGVDLTTTAPIDTALKKFAAVIEDAERTAEKLGL